MTETKKMKGSRLMLQRMVENGEMSGFLKGPKRLNSTEDEDVYHVGDRVYLDLGTAGRVGPGEVISAIQIEEPNQKPWRGYQLEFVYDKELGETFKIGYLASDFLAPADED